MKLTMSWKSASNPPELHKSECGWLRSKPVLAYDGLMMFIATYDRIKGDYSWHSTMDDDYGWYSHCSERWRLAEISHWMELPEPPPLNQ